MPEQTPDERIAELRGRWTVPTVERPTRRPPTICRCGHRDDNQLGTPPEPRPVADLRDDLTRTVTVLTERPHGVKRCRTCDHSVGAGALAIGHGPTTTVRDLYHPECVVIDVLTLMPGDVVVVTYSRNDGTPQVGHALVLDTHYPPNARPQARLRAPADLADAHRDPAQPDTYRVWADTVGRVTDPTVIAAVKGADA